MRYSLLFVLAVFLAGCNEKRDFNGITSTTPPVWYLRFEDGTEVEIEKPTFAKKFYECASAEYWAKQDVHDQVENIRKYLRQDGYTVFVNERKHHVPICKEIKQ